MLLINVLVSIGLLCHTFSQARCNKLSYTLGIESLAHEKQKIAECEKVALVTNQSGKDQRGRRTIDILLTHKVDLKCILVPEHGLDGSIPAGHPVPDSHDIFTGIPVLSLYEHNKGKKIEKSLIDSIDTIMIDVQDSGMRHFTYISTLYNLLEAAGKLNKKIIVLDRPNPLADVMEGPLVDADCFSFFSIAPIPLRHGMTIGELALYFNKYLLKSMANLHVIRMKNFDRTKGIENTLHNPISPNIRTISSCYGYSFLGLLGEIRPFDVGIYQGKPFQVLMLPDKDTSVTQIQWQELASRLKRYGIKSFRLHHTNQQRKASYSGLSISIEDISQVHAFQVLLTIVEYMHKIGVPISIKPSGMKALGTKKLDLVLEQKFQRKNFIDNINRDLEHFYTKAKSCFLYKPWPRIVKSE